MTSAPARWIGPRLFALSFCSLFLELMVIRWVPSSVRLIAYYGNLMLISSFLGLGAGAMLAGRARRLLGWVPALLLLEIIAMLVCRHVLLPTDAGEKRFYSAQAGWISYLVLVAIFAINSAVFVPIGQAIGELFPRMPALRAYAWDLGGSLAGTLAFGVFSFFWFSPVMGTSIVLLIVLALSSRRRVLANLPVALIALWGMTLTVDAGAIWSPYYYITVASVDAPALPAGPPPSDIRTRIDPPLYIVRVNQDFYQLHGTLDAKRYRPGGPKARLVENLRDQYLLPYSLASGRDRIAVVGAGGGMDVEAALLSGARHVDAVDIDPVIVSLSRRYAASGVYDDPRVAVRIDDARAFLRSGRPGYDMVVFGFLDSQALFSAMANLRLDGFTYTVESFRAADRLLGPDGMLVVSFASGEGWVTTKLVGMLERATGRLPIAFEAGAQVILCVPKRAPASVAPRFGRFRRVDIATAPAMEVPPPATDDWPYLYLLRRTIPRDYRAALGVMLVLSIATILSLRGRRFGADDAHMVSLGCGFLLLQTKAIGDCSLYFGTTWVVTMIVITGVLAMVLFANAVATTMIRGTPAWPYAPLFLTLAVLALVPREQILAWPYAARLAWTLLAVPLPIFFAGLIFSSSFRAGRDTAALFGANLIGAVLGGFCEYLGMAIGSSRLSWLVFAAYAASFVFRTSSRRAVTIDGKSTVELDAR